MKNKQRKAAALNYDSSKPNAPRVTATGRGLVAENMLNKAKKESVPIQEDASLAELLGELNINESIPPDLYQAVAEVFAFVYQADQRMEKKK